MTTEVFAATHDLKRRTLHVGLERYEAEFELEVGGRCTTEMAEGFESNARCVERHEFDARWTKE